MLKYYPFVKRATFFLLFTILFFYCLIIARTFFYPLCLAIVFSYLLYPLGRFLEKKHFPRIAANFVCLIVALATIIFVVFLISSQLEVFVQDFPMLKAKAMVNLDKIALSLENETGVSSRVQKIWLKARIEGLFETGGKFFSTAFNATAGTLVALGILPVYVFFFLYYRNKFKEFFLMIVPDRIHDKSHKILDEVSYVTKRYMTGITTVVFILCFVNSIGLIIVGIDYPILLGIISAFFNFIPYFGTLIGGLIPFLVAIITMDSPHYALGVAILFLIIQFLENNILTPNITGGNVKLNPFMTILSIIVGGLVWGVPGMFLSVPFLAMFKIVCDHVEPLRPISFLLGTQGTEKHAFTLKKIGKIFQKNKKDT